LNKEGGGEKTNLSKASLLNADLRDANLSGASFGM